MSKKLKKRHPAQTVFSGGYGTYTVDLGQGVGIRWVTWREVIVGGILSHPKKDGINGRCDGAFYLRNNIWQKEHPEDDADQWDFNGDFEKPDMSPSFKCHCDFHGFVKNGAWVNA